MTQRPETQFLQQSIDELLNELIHDPSTFHLGVHSSVPTNVQPNSIRKSQNSRPTKLPTRRIEKNSTRSKTLSRIENNLQPQLTSNQDVSWNKKPTQSIAKSREPLSKQGNKTPNQGAEGDLIRDHSRHTELGQWAYSEDDSVQDFMGSNDKYEEKTNESNEEQQSNPLEVSQENNVDSNSRSNTSNVTFIKKIASGKSNASIDSVSMRETISPELLAYFEKRMKESGMVFPTQKKRPRTATTRSRSTIRLYEENRQNVKHINETQIHKESKPKNIHSGRSSLRLSQRGRKKVTMDTPDFISTFGNTSTIKNVYEKARRLKKDPNAPEYLKMSLQYPIRQVKKIMIVNKNFKRNDLPEEDVFKGFNISTKARSMTVGGNFSKDDRSRHIFWKQWGSDAPPPNTYDITKADKLTQQKRPGSAFFGSERKCQYDKNLLQNAADVPGPQYNPQYSQVYPHSYEVTIKDPIPVMKVRRDEQIDYMRESFGMSSRSSISRRKRQTTRQSDGTFYDSFEDCYSTVSA